VNRMENGIVKYKQVREERSGAREITAQIKGMKNSASPSMSGKKARKVQQERITQKARRRVEE